VRDAILFGATIAAFALLVTAHVTIALGLVRRVPRWRGLVAFVLPPLAPYLAARAQMRVRATAWMCALVVYAVMRLVERAE
jgi:hypothetical protein